MSVASTLIVSVPEQISSCNGLAKATTGGLLSITVNRVKINDVETIRKIETDIMIIFWDNFGSFIVPTLFSKTISCY